MNYSRLHYLYAVYTSLFQTKSYPGQIAPWFGWWLVAGVRKGGHGWSALLLLLLALLPLVALVGGSDSGDIGGDIGEDGRARLAYHLT